MKRTQSVKVIGRKRPAVAVIGVSCDKDSLRCTPSGIHDDRGVVEAPRSLKPQLNDVARLYTAQTPLCRTRSYSAASHKKPIQLLHTRPSRRAVVYTAVVPAADRRIIHHRPARKQALRSKVSTIAAYVGEVIKERIAKISPFLGIPHRRISVVFQSIASFLIYCMLRLHSKFRIVINWGLSGRVIM